MKRHVLIGLTAMLCCFFTGGFYILVSIDGVTDKLEKVTSLHQVEFLRVNLENHIRAVQSDLLLQDTVHARDIHTVSRHIETMESSAHICSSCHHGEETRKNLRAMEDATHTYMEASLVYINAFNQALFPTANDPQPELLQQEALSQGERLLDKVHVLSVTSGKRIAERITRIHRDITDTKQLIISLVVLGPLAILFITGYFLRRFTGAIDTLVVATQHLEQGNLDYQIHSPLKDEFSLLAGAFNNMALSLKNQRHELESLHKRYQTLFESAGDAICIIEIESEKIGQIVSANQAATRLYGHPVDELIGMNIRALTPEGSLDEFKERLAQMTVGDWLHFVVDRKRRDGTIFPAELSVGLLEMENRHYVLSYSRDITKRRQAEQELMRANQMAGVGQMAVGLAHEIKNPLAGIKVSLEVLADELTLGPEDKELFARVINEINRMERLLKNMLNYARPPQPQFDLLDVNQLLDYTMKNVEITTARSAHKHIVFSREFSPDLNQIEADSSQLQQVFLNIFLNAIEAISEEGKITAKTAMELNGGSSIEISDTGKGMDEATVAEIFNPFFTTRSKGTGLGLAISKRLIEQHGGVIEVASQRGHGTTFTLRLPQTQKNLE